MLQVFIQTQPWDFEEGRLEAALDDVRGTLGVTGLTLVVASPPRAALRCGPGTDLAIVRTHGGLLYAPQPEAFASTRCRPVGAEVPGAPAHLVAAAAAIRQRGLGLRVAVSALRLGGLAEHHPARATKNVLDDVSHARVCPTHPDVQAMAAALLADVGRVFSPDAVVLHDWDLGWLGEATCDLTLPLADTELVDLLLALCFCDSCRRQAAEQGLDAAAAARSARTILCEAVGSAAHRSRPFHKELAGDDVLKAYLEGQAAAFARATTRLAGASDVPVVLHRTGREIADPLESVRPGVAGVCWRYSGSEFPDGCELEFCVGPETVRRPQALVADVAAATTRGVDTLTFTELGRLNPPADEAVKQAIRYARRSAS
jgi:hypothetical protein